MVRYVQKKHSNLSQDLIFKIFESNFIDNKIIADIDTLVEIASSLGLDDIEIRNMLESDSYDFEVRVEEEEAMIMGVELPSPRPARYTPSASPCLETS